MRTAAPLAATLAILLLLAHGAAAQSTVDVDTADALFKAAKAAMDRGDLAAACPQFAESQRLDPATGTLLNLGECEARQGRVAAALRHFQEARAALPPGDYRVAFADEKMASLGRRVARLTVKVSGDLPPGSRMQCDGVDLPAESIGVPTPVDPGAHVLTLSAPGHAAARADVTLTEGQVATSEIAPGPSTLPDVGAASSGSPQRTTGLVLVGTGAVGLAVGTIVGLVAKGDLRLGLEPRNCPTGPSSCNLQGVQGGSTAHGEAAVSTAAFVAGGLLAATGGLLYFTAPREGRVSLSASVDRGSAGVVVRGAW